MSVLRIGFLMGILCLLFSLPEIANSQILAISGFKPVSGTNKVIGYCSTSAPNDTVAGDYAMFYAYCDVQGGGNTYYNPDVCPGGQNGAIGGRPFPVTPGAGGNPIGTCSILFTPVPGATYTVESQHAVVFKYSGEQYNWSDPLGYYSASASSAIQSFNGQDPTFYDNVACSLRGDCTAGQLIFDRNATGKNYTGTSNIWALEKTTAVYIPMTVTAAMGDPSPALFQMQQVNFNSSVYGTGTSPVQWCSQLVNVTCIIQVSSGQGTLDPAQSESNSTTFVSPNLVLSSPVNEYICADQVNASWNYACKPTLLEEIGINLSYNPTISPVPEGQWPAYLSQNELLAMGYLAPNDPAPFGLGGTFTAQVGPTGTPPPPPPSSQPASLVTPSFVSWGTPGNDTTWVLTPTGISPPGVQVGNLGSWQLIADSNPSETTDTYTAPSVDGTALLTVNAKVDLSANGQVQVQLPSGTLGPEPLVTTATISVNNGKAPQTIDFSAIPNQLVTAEPLLLTAASLCATTPTPTTNLTITFTSATTSVCTVSGDVATMQSVGTCVILASQPGDALCQPAQTITYPFQVLPLPPAPEPEPEPLLPIPWNATPLPNINIFNPSSVGGTSPVSSVVFTFDSASVLGNVAVLSEGTSGLDFENAGTGTCSAGTNYAVGSTCTVNTTFTPSLAGVRYGTVILADNSGNTVAIGYLQGTGLGPQLNFLPGAESTVPTSTLNSPGGVAVDGSGNVYIADANNTRVLKESLSAASYTESIVPTSSLNNPFGVAVDGGGNVYVADTGNSRVLTEVQSAGSYFEITLPTSPLNYPAAIAVDGSGNVYIADSGNNRVLKEAVSAGIYTESTVPSSALNGPSGVAVDGSGNVYITDSGNNRVLKETLSSGNYTETLVQTSSLSSPFGITVDRLGNIFIVDSGNNRVLKETPSGSSYIESAVATSSLSSPEAVAVAGNGNVYVADTGNNRILEEDLRDSPSLNFASTAIGSTSSNSPQIVTILNAGNAVLNFPVPSSGNNPSISANFTLKSNGASACPQVSAGSSTAGLLVAGQSCLLPISFTPTEVGTISGALTLTDNAFNPVAPGTLAQQSLVLSGTGTGGTQQTITFGSIAAQNANTTLVLTATASSGLPVSYTSTTPTICTVSASAVTFIIAGACTIQATQPGNAIYEPAPMVSQSISVEVALSLVGANIGAVNIGSPSSSIAVPLIFGTAATLGSVSVVTQGASGLDFENASEGTCAVETSYNTGESCTVNVVFTPLVTGTSYGAVVLEDGSGNVIATSYLQGTGVGPQVAFLPGTMSTVPTSAWGLKAFAVDSSGNIYLAGEFNNLVYKETLSGGAYTESAIPTSALNAPQGIAVDGSGNMYIADTNNHRVLKETLSSGGNYTESTLPTSTYSPYGIAVDGSGNVYIADPGAVDSGNQQVWMEKFSAGGYTESTVPNSAAVPTGVAVDGSGNVYITDENRVLKETLSAGTYTETTLPTNTNDGPEAVAVDGNGNVYIPYAYSVGSEIEYGVWKETLSSGSYTESTLPTNGLSSLFGVAVDGSGNVYIADLYNSGVLKEDFADPPSLNFAMAAPGSTSSDSPQTVTVENVGNASLNFPAPSSGNNPSIGTNFTLNSSVASSCPLVRSGSSTIGTLAAGQSCLLPISFTPTAAGTFSSTLVLTENALNGTAHAYTALSIQLSGIGTGAGGVQQVITFVAIPAQAVNSTFTLTATASSGLPVTYNSATPTICTVSGAEATLLALGTCSIEANQIGNTTYVPAPMVSQSFTVENAVPLPNSTFGMVNLGNSSSVFAVPVTIATGATLGTVYVLTQGAVGLDFSNAGAGTCTAGTSFNAGGACTVNVTFTPTLAGTRYGAVVLQDGSGNVIATSYLQGTGVGPQVAFLPGTISTVPTGAWGPNGVAVDGNENVYVADRYNSLIFKETFSAGSYTDSTVPTSQLNGPEGIAVDGAGNVYIADTFNQRVLKETLSSGGYTEITVPTSSLKYPMGIAVDGSGNLYIADTNNQRVLKEAYLLDSYVESVVATGDYSPYNIAVDGGGNVYIATDSQLFKETLSAGTFTQSTLPSAGGATPGASSIAVDGSGNVYFTNSYLVYKDTPSGGSYIMSTLAGLNGSALNGIAVDGRNNVYVTDLYSANQVTEQDFADPPSLSFALTAPGSTSSDSPQTVTIENVGNAVLNFPVLGSGNNPSIGTNFFLNSSVASSCPLVSSGLSTIGTLAAGQSCLLPISFTPMAAGTFSGTLVLTDNTLDAAAPMYSVQSLLLSGIGTGAGGVQQGITFVAIPAQSVNSTLTLTATASSGLPVSFSSITPAVCTVSGSAVSLLALGDCTIQANQVGSTVYVAAPMVSQSFAVESYIPPTGTNFGVKTIGSTSSPISVPIAFATASTMASISVLTQGAAGLDFANAGAGTCTAGTSYNAGASCVVNVAFTPTVAGTRYGEVVAADGSGNVIATSYLQGTGVAPQVTFLPGAESTVPTSSLSQPMSVAVDGSGNVYIADSYNNRVLKETLSSGSYTESTVPTSALNTPYAVALDGGGNVYVADTANNRVLKETLSSGSYTEITVPTSALNGPDGIAVDGSGNVYISDSGNGRVLKETPTAGTYAESIVLAIDDSYPNGIAVDGSGDVYIDATFQLLKETPSEGSYTESIVPTSTLSYPVGVAVDGFGNVYIANTGYSTILKETLSGGSYIESTLPTSANSPWGIAVNGNGNVYIASSYGNQILKEDYADPPSLSFASTVANSTSSDSPQTVTLENVGNATLNFPIPGRGNNPSIASNFTLNSSGTSSCPLVSAGASTPGTLTAGQSCALPISFTPATVGAFTGGLTLNDNALNATAPGYAAQSILLSGTGMPQGTTQQTISFGAISAQTANSTLALTASASSGLPVTYISTTPSICTISGPTASLFAGGTCTIQANQAGNSVYAVAPTVTQSFTVNLVAQTIDFQTPSSPVTYGVARITLYATATSGLGVTLSVTGPASVSGSTLTIGGSGSVVVTASQPGNSGYSAATAVSYTITVTKAVLKVTATSASRTYGAANPTFTDSITGFVNGDTVASATTGTASLTTTATTSSTPGTYTITAGAGTLAASNYTFNYVNGTLTVGKAGLTVTAANASRAHGAANPTFTDTITGFLNGDTVASATTGAASLTTTATTSSVPGTYTITGAAGTLAATNYSFAFVNETLTVTPLGTVATPTFSPVAGTYTSAQSVTITDSTSGAVIYYTTNGTTPTTSSTKYTTKITVSSTETVEAIAVVTGYTNSAVASAAYTIK
jgi:streptogramin lyase